MINRLPLPISCVIAITLSTTLVQNAKADIDFKSAIFQTSAITQNDVVGYAITADVYEAGVVAGELSASVEYGGGNNPFNTGDNWGHASGAYKIWAETTNTFAGNDTADGFWNISVTPAAGWQVDGISIYTFGSSLGNPDLVNLTSNGVGTVFDDSNLITNYNDGDSFINGDDLNFAGGSTFSGIPSADHSNRWAFNSAGATQMSFTYQVGQGTALGDIGIDALWVDVQMSTIAVPEPASATVALLALSTLCMRRRRR